MLWGGGGYAGGRIYPTGGGSSIIGDGSIYPALDGDCNRIKESYFLGDLEPNFNERCEINQIAGDLYGCAIGAYGHELGHAFDIPHPDAYGYPRVHEKWSQTLLGNHCRYPNTGLIDEDRERLAVSPYIITPFDTTTTFTPTTTTTTSTITTVINSTTTTTIPIPISNITTSTTTSTTICTPSNQCENYCEDNDCFYMDRCLPYGIRTSGKFCDLNGNMRDYKSEYEICSEDFECKTNLCINSECVSGTLWQRIVKWFSF